MEFDLLIRGGTVVDGSGETPARVADVAIVGDRVAALGDLSGATAATVVDAAGQVVAPGFIDPHVHSEIALLGGPHRYGALLQGVTTHLLAPDGFGWAQLDPQRAREMWEYLEFAYGQAHLSPNWPTPDSYLELFRGHTPANVVPQVPHCAVRVAAMGWEPRPATDAELAKMADLTRAWMEAGAVGLCAGLDYQPAAYCDTRELVALGKVIRPYGGIYAAHLRYNLIGKAEAWREMMAVSRQAEIPVHVSHEYATPESEALLDEARGAADLTFESYMYPAGCSHLTMALPTWAQAGGTEGVRQRLKDPELRRQMQAFLQQKLTDGQFTKLVFVATPSGRYIGQSIPEVAEAEGLSLGELALRVIEQEEPYALMIWHRAGTPEQHLETTRRTIRHPAMLVASDGVYHGASGHPRGYGCFARVLRHCVRELKAVSLEQAVHKMSGFTAARFGLKDRGLLRPGYGADVVIFDPETVADRSTWEDPWVPPSGISRVLVNGREVVRDGQPTGLLPGRVIRRA